MEFTGKHILVTGGAGFIGSHLVDALLQEGAYVRVIDNLVNGKRENIAHHAENDHFTFIRGDITDPFDVAEAMQDIECVFHLACLGVRHSIKHPFETHRVNAEGTLFVLQEALRNGVEKFVYCSSSEIYGTAQYVPMKEEHPARPNTIYGASKLAGETYTRAYYETYGLNTVIIRPFNTYGPRSHHEGDAGELIPKSIVRALNGEALLIFGDGSQTRDFTYVTDSAQGMLAIARNDSIAGQTFNMGSEFEISIQETALRIVELTGSTTKIRNIENRPGDVLRLYADASKFREITGWKPLVSFEDGLIQTIRWFGSRPEGAAVLLSQERAMNWE